MSILSDHNQDDGEPISPHTTVDVPFLASELPGARESNAGDDFHFLWAVRVALKLLTPASNLEGIVIEGVSQEDRTAIAQDDLLLGVDLTEYYGGKSFNESSQVIASQLKYSTRHPEMSWTTARLCTKTSKTKNNAIIARLASIASGYRNNAGIEEVKSRLLIRLVSNQPADAALISAVAEAKDALKKHSLKRVADLHRYLSETDWKEIETLYKAAGTTSADFLVFLSVFDLSQCGASSRALLRIQTLQQIGLSSLSPGEDLRRLYDLIRDLAGPGNEEYLITRLDVLAALELGLDSSLFPAPPNLEYPKPSLETEDARRVAEFVLHHRGSQVIIHGTAGIGKTTTLSQLKEHLPENAEVFQYDCYGGGRLSQSWAGAASTRGMLRPTLQ